MLIGIPRRKAIDRNKDRQENWGFGGGERNKGQQGRTEAKESGREILPACATMHAHMDAIWNWVLINYQLSTSQYLAGVPA